MRNGERRVVVTGMGIISPFGAGLDITREGLWEGRDCARPVRGIDPLGLKGRLACQIPESDVGANLEGSQPRWIRRATRLLLTALDEALGASSDSQSIPEGVRLVLATTLGGIESGMGYHCDLLAGRRGNATDLLDYLALSQPTSVLIQRGGLARPQVVSNACASGTSALGLAFRYVKSGRDDLALVAGYDPMSAFTFWGFNSLRLVTPERCRPFDTRRSGLVLGEGAAAFVLEERDRAVARGAPIFGEILGYGETNDAHHPTHPHPEGRGALAAMNRALHEAGLSPADLDYVNAHGTGTRANDASEALALATLLGDAAASVPVSSTKGHVGHCLGAAGALEAAFTWIALGRGFLPPTVNLEEPDPAFPLQFVRGASRRTSAEFALSNSFGFGGSNASVVLRRGEATP